MKVFFFSFVLVLFSIISTCDSDKFDDEESDRELPFPPVCGNPKHITKRSVGGKPTYIYYFPWMAALQYKENGDYDVKCGGALINHRYVITAAHCIDDTLEYVILGSTNVKAYSNRIKVDRTVIHEHYIEDAKSFFSVPYDIGIVRLSERVDFSRTIAPICLPFQIKNYSEPTINTTFTLSGWGTKQYDVSDNILNYVDLKFYDFKECQEVFLMFGAQLSSKVFCAGGQIGIDSCYGDSGSPLVRKIGNTWFMEGIVTGGVDSGCGTLNPASYAKVTKYEKWIKDKVRYDLKNGQNGLFPDHKILLVPSFCLLAILFG